MQGEEAERWRELCAAIAEEKDHERLLKMVEELNRLLEQRESRMRVRKQNQEPS